MPHTTTERARSRDRDEVKSRRRRRRARASDGPGVTGSCARPARARSGPSVPMHTGARGHRARGRRRGRRPCCSNSARLLGSAKSLARSGRRSNLRCARCAGVRNQPRLGEFFRLEGVVQRAAGDHRQPHGTQLGRRTPNNGAGPSKDGGVRHGTAEYWPSSWPGMAFAAIARAGELETQLERAALDARCPKVALLRYAVCHFVTRSDVSATQREAWTGSLTTHPRRPIATRAARAPRAAAAGPHPRVRPLRGSGMPTG
jgi:hypothetical protein